MHHASHQKRADYQHRKTENKHKKNNLMRKHTSQDTPTPPIFKKNLPFSFLFFALSQFFSIFTLDEVQTTRYNADINRKESPKIWHLINQTRKTSRSISACIAFCVLSWINTSILSLVKPTKRSKKQPAPSSET